LEQFIGNLIKKASSAVSSFARSSAGKALGGVLKGVAKKALPVVGGALGSLVAPGVGTAIGSKLGSLASGLFEVELEAMPAEHAELEVARRFVGLATAAARTAAMARPRPGTSPQSVARAAVAKAAHTYAPGLARQMVGSLRSTVPSRRGAPGGYAYRGYPTRPSPAGGYGRPTMGPRAQPAGGYGRPTPAGRPPTAPTGAPVSADGRPMYGGRPGRYGPPWYYSYGYAQFPSDQPAPPTGGAEPIEEPWTEPWDGVEPTTMGAPGASGRWIRRGRKIVLLGV
jgi:uncharacterized protein (DUF697 family)